MVDPIGDCKRYTTPSPFPMDLLLLEIDEKPPRLHLSMDPPLLEKRRGIFDIVFNQIDQQRFLPFF
jgi:hypothetical protein